jgi:hypothetical protein
MSEVLSDYADIAEEVSLSLSVYIETARQIVRAVVAGRVYFTETGELIYFS